MAFDHIAVLGAGAWGTALANLAFFANMFFIIDTPSFCMSLWLFRNFSKAVN